MKLDLPWKHPILLAHRGASASAPENTLAAFRLALEQGADGIELDAKFSADGEVVVIHDATVNRTTNGSGAVKNLSLAQLRELDAGSHFSKVFAGEKIPTLGEVFEAVGKQCWIDIEITNYAAMRDGLADRLVDLVKYYQIQDQVLFSSFLPFNIARVRRLLPEVPAGLLAWTGFPGWLARGRIGEWFSPDLIIPQSGTIQPQYMDRMRARGQEVIAWTVDDPGEARRLLAWGVNGIITNDPLHLREELVEGGEG
jgi:glycerophosphoryl diester phosphodiesterase